MGADPRVLAVARQDFSGLQNFEKLHQAARGLAGAVEKIERGMIGGGLLRDREPHERALADRLRAEERRTVTPGDRGRRADYHRDDLLDTGVVHRLLAAYDVTAGNVAGLVRDDADQLVRRFRPQDEPGIDKDRLAAGDKRVQLIVLDQVDPDVL